MTDVLSRFSFTTAAEKQLKHRNHCKKQYFLVVGWKKWCLKKGIAKEIENYEPTQLNTAGAIRNLKKTWLNLGNDDSISSTVIRTQTEQFLELFSRTLKDVKISLHITVLIVSGCFDRTHGLNKLFLHLMRALCLCLIMISHLVFFMYTFNT